MKQLFIGIIAEGTTDYRFLEPIIEKSLSEIILDQNKKLGRNN